MIICKARKSSELVIAINRNRAVTIYIGFKKKVRVLLEAYNIEFDREYQIIQHDAMRAAETWLKSPIKMSAKAREVLQMIVATRKNKVVGQFNDGDVVEPNEGTKLYTSIEDVLAEKSATIAALNKAAGGEAFTDTDKPTNASITWENMCNFEIPAPKIKEPKAPKVPKEKKVKEPKEPKAPGVKQQIRALLTSGTVATATELQELTGAKTLSNVVTAVTDLKSEKYCGEGGPLVIVSQKSDAGIVYSLEEFAV